MHKENNPINLSDYKIIHKDDTETSLKLKELCEKQMMEIMKIDKNLLNERTTRNVSKRI